MVLEAESILEVETSKSESATSCSLSNSGICVPIGTGHAHLFS